MLLHSCCAPCSGEVMEAVLASGLDLTVYFYNPNIHPREEYELRKAENIRFAEKHSVPFIDGDYDMEIGLRAQRVSNGSPSAARGAQCASICDSSERLFTRMKMASRSSRVASAFPGGKTWSRSTCAGSGRRRVTRE